MQQLTSEIDKKRPTEDLNTGSRWKRRFGKPQGLLLHTSVSTEGANAHAILGSVAAFGTSKIAAAAQKAPSSTSPVLSSSNRDQRKGKENVAGGFSHCSSNLKADQRPAASYSNPLSFNQQSNGVRACKPPEQPELGSDSSRRCTRTSYSAWHAPGSSADDPEQSCTPFGTVLGATPAASFCPTCGLYLQDVAETEPERLAHISSCAIKQEDADSETFFDAASEGEAGQQGDTRDESEEADFFDDASEGEAGQQGDDRDVSKEAEGLCTDWDDAEEPIVARTGSCCEKDAEPDSYINLSDDDDQDICQPQAPGGCDSGSPNMGAPAGASGSPIASRVCQAACEQPGESAAGEVDIAAWLAALGCSQYSSGFRRAELRVSVVALLTDEDLQQLGVSAMGHRRRILAAAGKLAKGVDKDGNADGGGEAGPARQQTVAPAGLRSVAEALMRPRVFDDGVPAQASTSGVLGRGRRITDFFAARAPASGVARRPPRRPTEDRVRVPEWHRVPGTSFVVDKFGRQFENSVSCCSWFLTHFHADHYGGLSGRFKSGVVYCTRITAKLVNQRLSVSWSRLKVVELRKPIVVEGVRVTYLEANHCPGAAMILFEVPGKRPMLHSGDCRCHPGMQEEPLLRQLVGQADLVMDTTYCNPQYDFPPQHEVLRFVVDAVRAEEFNSSTLFLFGSYTVGKERLFLEAARILQQKVYVSRAKRKVLEALDLPPEYRSLLTENDREARIQAVPLAFVNMKRMAHIAKHYRSRFSTIVGFQPTGWTHSAERGRASRGRRHQKGSLILYQVPYSEHSSFREMREFVQWLQPKRIIPSVGNDRGAKARKMVSLLRD